MLESDISQEQRRDALASINIIKEKRGGGIKGRSVAVGRKQKNFYKTYYITSLTISTYTLLMTLMVDVWEQLAVGTSYVRVAYLQADMEDLAILRKVGTSVDVLCKVNREYKHFLIEERGNKLIYLRIKKALYGCIQLEMLLYNIFSETLKKMVFKINPYTISVLRTRKLMKKMHNGFVRGGSEVHYANDIDR